VLLKDDKKYPYLCITGASPNPRISSTRRRRTAQPCDRFYGHTWDVGLLAAPLFLVKRVFHAAPRPQPLRETHLLNFDIGPLSGVCREDQPEITRRTLAQVAMVYPGPAATKIRSCCAPDGKGG